MKISIVTPSLNQGRFLERTIRSVLEQDHPDVEYFVMDGGSKDESVAILKKYSSRLAGWVSEPDRGQADAISKGFRRCTGDLLAYLNSSDEYEPDALRRVAEAAEKSKAALYYGDVRIIDEDGAPLDVESGAHLDLDAMTYENVFPFQPGAFWSRAAYEECGGIDPKFHFYLDLDLFIRLARCGTMKYVPATLARLRRHGDAKTNARHIARWARERDEIVRLYAKGPVKTRRVLSFLKRAGRFAIEKRWYELGKMMRKVQATWKK